MVKDGNPAFICNTMVNLTGKHTPRHCGILSYSLNQGINSMTQIPGLFIEFLVNGLTLAVDSLAMVNLLQLGDKPSGPHTTSLV